MLWKKSLKIKPHGGADQRSEQRAGAADRGLHDELARSFECEGLGRHEALHQPEQPAGKSGIGGSDDEGGELIVLDVVAEGGRTQRIVADRAEDRADRRANDAQRDHDADEIAKRQQPIERRVAIELKGGETEVENRGRHARKPVLAAGEIGKGIELDEIEYFPDRHRDHGEVDAGAPQRDQPDQIADGRRRDRADEHRRHDVRKVHDRQ